RVSDLVGVAGRELLDRLEVSQPWRGTIDASLALIEDLDGQIRSCERELRDLGADHEYVPLLMSAPGIAWVLGYTIAAEVGDIKRFDSPSKLCGYTGLCPRVHQSGERDHRVGPPRNRIRDGRRTWLAESQGRDSDGADLARVLERMGGLPRRGFGVSRARRGAW